MDDYISGFGPPMDDDDVGDSIEEVMRLPPKQALGVSVACLQALVDPIGRLAYPEWQGDMVKQMVRCCQMSGGVQLPGTLIQLALVAAVVVARLNQIAINELGVEPDPEDESAEMTDPATILQGIIENLPPEDYFQNAVDGCREMYADLKPKVSDEQAKEMEEWFNESDAEEPDAAA